MSDDGAPPQLHVHSSINPSLPPPSPHQGSTCPYVFVQPKIEYILKSTTIFLYLYRNVTKHTLHAIQKLEKKKDI